MLLILIPQDHSYYLGIKRKLPLCGRQLIPHILHNHIRHKPHIRLWFYAASLLHNGDMFSNRGLSLENGSRQHTSSFIIYKIQSFLYIINKLGEDLNKTLPNYLICNWYKNKNNNKNQIKYHLYKTLEYFYKSSDNRIN